MGVPESAFASSEDKCGHTMLHKLSMAKEVGPLENLDCVESTVDVESSHIECTDSASVVFGCGTSSLSEIPPIQPREWLDSGLRRETIQYCNESGLSGETMSKAFKINF